MEKKHDEERKTRRNCKKGAESRADRCKTDVVVHLGRDGLSLLLVAHRSVIQTSAEPEQSLSSPRSELLLEFRQRHLLQVPT